MNIVAMKCAKWVEARAGSMGGFRVCLVEKGKGGQKG